TAVPLAPARSRTMRSSACRTTSVCSVVIFASASTAPAIGLLFVNQSHSCCPDWYSSFSVIDATRISFSPTLAISWCSLGILQLERQRRRIHWRAGEAGDGGLDGANEEVEEFNPLDCAEHSHQHPPPRLSDARQLTDSARHVRKEHDAKLRAGDVEG